MVWVRDVRFTDALLQFAARVHSIRRNNFKKIHCKDRHRTTLVSYRYLCLETNLQGYSVIYFSIFFSFQQMRPKNYWIKMKERPKSSIETRLVFLLSITIQYNLSTCSNITILLNLKVYITNSITTRRPFSQPPTFRQTGQQSHLTFYRPQRSWGKVMF